MLNNTKMQKQKKRVVTAVGRFLFVLFFIFSLNLQGLQPAQAEVVRDIAFPVEGPTVFTDTFGHPRSGGRVHEGIDLAVEKHTPALAAVDGTVVFAPETEPAWGWGIWIRDAEGYEYCLLYTSPSPRDH